MASDVYGPREDTALLRAAAVEEAEPDDVVLEVGSGSGAVAAAVDDVAARVVATDVEPAAVRATRARGVPAVRTDLVAGIGGDVDLVLCNPPYLPSEDRTPDDGIATAVEGGPEGRQVAVELLETVGRVMAKRGRLLLLVTSAAGIDEVRSVAVERGFDWTVVASDRYFFEKFVVARLRPA